MKLSANFRQRLLALGWIASVAMSAVGVKADQAYRGFAVSAHSTRPVYLSGYEFKLHWTKGDKAGKEDSVTCDEKGFFTFTIKRGASARIVPVDDDVFYVTGSDDLRLVHVRRSSIRGRVLLAGQPFRSSELKIIDDSQGGPVDVVLGEFQLPLKDELTTFHPDLPGLPEATKFKFFPETAKAYPGQSVDFTVLMAPIKGKVTMNGSGIPGVTLSITNSLSRTLATRLTTDANGTFTSGKLPIEWYHVAASYPDFTFAFGPGAVGKIYETVRAGDLGVEIKVATGPVAGRVGTVEAGVGDVGLSAKGTGKRTKTAPDGSFKFIGLEPNQSGYVIVAEHKNIDFVASEKTAYLGDLDMSFTPLFQIRGVVQSLDDNAQARPRIGLEIQAQKLDGAGNAQGRPIEATVNESGVYTIRGLLAGSYRVESPAQDVALRSDIDPAASDGRGVRIAINKGSIDNLDVIASLTVRGRVLEGEAGVAGISVGVSTNGNTVETVKTDQDGQFTWPGARLNGKVPIRFTPSSPTHKFVPQYREVAASPDLGALQFTAVGLIAGQVLFEGGVPASGITVHATNKNTLFTHATISAEPPSKKGESAAGSFIFSDLPKAPFSVAPVRSGYRFEPAVIDTMPGGRDPVIFKVVQSPPRILPINRQRIRKGSPSRIIQVTIADRETPASELKIRVESSRTDIIPNGSNGILVGDSGDFRTLQLTPAPGATGTATITVTVIDSEGAMASIDFDAQVDVVPAYDIIDLGTLDEANSRAVSLNNQGVVLAEASSPGATRFFVYRPDTQGAGGGSTEIRVQVGATQVSPASAAVINDNGDIAGTVLSGGATVPFVLADSTTTLFTAQAGAVVAGLTDNGTLVGSYPNSPGRAPFRAEMAVPEAAVNLPVLADYSLHAAAAVSGNGRVVGYSDSGKEIGDPADDRHQMFRVVSGAGSAEPLGTGRLIPTAVNRVGTVVGTNAFPAAPFWMTADGNQNGLGSLAPGKSVTPLGLNDTDEIVGTAQDESGAARAFLSFGGELTDLNSTIEAGSRWVLEEAVAINNAGQIAGTGRINGARHAFLAIPVTFVGEPVPLPEGAVAIEPLPDDIVILTDPDDRANSKAFEWSRAERRLYAVRKVTALIKWPVSENRTDTTRIPALVRTVWPRQPQAHVAGAPVELEPQGASIPYRFLNIAYSQIDGAVDEGTRTFNTGADKSGYTVLHFKNTGGGPVRGNPDDFNEYYRVVRSSPWTNATAFPSGATPRTAIIGEAIEPRASFATTTLEFDGPNNDIEITARDFSAEYNEVRVIATVDPSLPAGQAGADYDPEQKVLNVRLSAERATASSVIAAINGVSSDRSRGLFTARAKTGQTAAGTIEHPVHLSLTGGDGIRLNPSFGWTALPFTFAGWVKLAPGAPPQDLLFGDAVIREVQFLCRVAAYGLSFSALKQTLPSAGTEASVTGPIADGQWHFIAVSLDADGATVFLDGASNSNAWSDGASENFPSGSPFLGEIGSGFRGGLDDLSFWRATLSQAQLRSLMDSFSSFKSAHPDLELVAHLALDEGKGTGFASPPSNAGFNVPDGAWSVVSAVTGGGGFSEHIDYPGKNGFVFNEKSFYDGAGPNRAYDRGKRMGPILPVNKPAAKTPPDRRMVVVWYQKDDVGFAWPVVPVQYQLEWPEAAEPIIISALREAPEMSPEAFPGRTIYSQDDPNLAGFNPNEEHAGIYDGRICALRNDLNRFLDYSDSYVLVKYRSLVDGAWRYRVFQVIDQDRAHPFVYPQAAGVEIQPPFPLYLVPLCGASEGVRGPYWEDYKGKIYAYGAGQGSANAAVVIHYHYPLQEGFYYPFQHANGAPYQLGDCIPWLDRLAGTPGVPYDITYDVFWPRNIPIVPLASTVFNSGQGPGLPDIAGQARIEVIHEAVNPKGQAAQSSVRSFRDSIARLYDPLSERAVDLPAADLPKVTRDPITGGREVFRDLPYSIRVRLQYDPNLRKLSFGGVILTKGQPQGNPLVLPNIITDDERLAIQALDKEDGTRWDAKVRELFDISRNPNRVDLDGVPGVDKNDVWVGVDYDPDRGGAVPEALGAGTKALTTGGNITAEAAALLSVDTQGRSIEFDGIDDYVELTDLKGLPRGNVAHTVEAWVRVDSNPTAGNARPLLLGTGAGAHEWILFPNGSMSVGAAGTDEPNRITTSPLPPNTWTHVAAVFDGAALRLYTNGEACLPDGGGRAVSFDLEGISLTLAKPPPRQAFFQGNIDEVRVWARPRSAAELQGAKDHTLTGDENGLALYWRCDESSGLVLSDSTGRGNNGQLLNILRFNGAGDYVKVPGFGRRMPAEEITIEFWQRAEESRQQSTFSLGRFGGEFKLVNFGAPWSATGGNAAYWDFGSIVTPPGGRVSYSPPQSLVGTWQHFAVQASRLGNFMRIYRNGVLEREKSAMTPFIPTDQDLYIGAMLAENENAAKYFFKGDIDQFQIWNEIRSPEQIVADQAGALTGNEPNLVLLWRADQGVVGDRDPRTRQSGPVHSMESPVLREPNGYVTLAVNNDPALQGLPVQLYILRIDPTLNTGSIRVIPSDNVFDEKLTLRLSGDFGGNPDHFEFQWWYYHGSDVPQSYPSDPGQEDWFEYKAYQGGKTNGVGQNQITLGAGAESAVLTVSDSRWLVRFRPVDTSYQGVLTSTWTPWIGAPESRIGTPIEPQLAEGWIKRVTAALNPFDQRIQNFRQDAVNTTASLLVSAGGRYTGDIAFNPDADNVNKVGLIEAYETVLRRARSLTLDNRIADAEANQALLLVTSRISDLYMFLGNEAYADAEDPTIGFTSPDGEVGTLAPAIFAFENQVDSLLEEELALLRGLDRDFGAPVYNRLVWNFTRGDGQIAYQQVYDVSDTETRDPILGEIIPRDGFITAEDAAVSYPQGHGDAWGHYLTALTGYYQLLRNANFAWQPRTESILLTGRPLAVDYEDERKFARAAAALARTGREIVDLTYRQKYVDEPQGQWQGYKDTEASRAWGVTEWARRAGQAAYFNWAVANAILPSTDPNPAHVGLEKIDRTTVSELKEIPAEYGAVQAEMDQADVGLNPLGLVKGAIAFDIDPHFNEVGSTTQGRTHFDQIQERALKAMNNAVAVFNHANSLTQNLRKSQDDANAFAQDVTQEERTFENRLIEIFGYPYSGDIGAGKPYASGYKGPDFIHFNYVDATELTGETPPGPPAVFTVALATAKIQISDLPDTADLPAFRLDVDFPMRDGAWPFTFEAEDHMGRRLAQGEIQVAISELLRANAEYQEGLAEYNNLVAQIESAAALLQARYNLKSEKIKILSRQRDTVIGLNAAIDTIKAAQVVLKATSDMIRIFAEAGEKALPTVVGVANDTFSVVRGALKGATAADAALFDTVSGGFDIAVNVAEQGKEVAELQTDIELETADQDYEIKQQLLELQQLIREEGPKRFALFNLKEVLRQNFQAYYSKLQEAERLLDAREAYRRRVAGEIAQKRYRDLTFRIFRNDAIQKYRSQFDLAARYVYLAATAYDYDTTFLGTQRTGAGRNFLTDIVRQRALGEWVDGEPIAGRHGLADALARLDANYQVLKPQLGLNNPELEVGEFSLRKERFRTKQGSPPSDLNWRKTLQKHRIANLWEVPEFRRYCRPFAPEAAGPQPGLVIPFSTTVTFGLNFFGWPLGPSESAYDSSRFSTKINSVGVYFEGYPKDAGGNLLLARTPRVYLVPVGTDIMRSAGSDATATREFQVIDQKIPIPFPVGKSDLDDPLWSPTKDSLDGSFVEVRRYASFRAFDADDFSEESPTTESRLVGRSVWNTRWLLIIPGGTFLQNADSGLDLFINSVSDIRLYLTTYAAPGD